MAWTSFVEANALDHAAASAAMNKLEYRERTIDRNKEVEDLKRENEELKNKLDLAEHTKKHLKEVAATMCEKCVMGSKQARPRTVTAGGKMKKLKITPEFVEEQLPKRFCPKCGSKCRVVSLKISSYDMETGEASYDVLLRCPRIPWWRRRNGHYRCRWRKHPGKDMEWYALYGLTLSPKYGIIETVES